MVFWFWISVCVMAVPAIVFALVFSALYLYLRLRYQSHLQKILKIPARTTKARHSCRKIRWFHWSLFLGACEIKAESDEDVRLKTNFLEPRSLAVVGGMLIILVCIAIGIVGGISMLG
jgi:hypothetical protein